MLLSMIRKNEERVDPSLFLMTRVLLYPTTCALLTAGDLGAGAHFRGEAIVTAAKARSVPPSSFRRRSTSPLESLSSSTLRAKLRQLLLVG